MGHHLIFQLREEFNNFMFYIILVTLIMYCLCKLFYDSIFVGCLSHYQNSNITCDDSACKISGKFFPKNVCELKRKLFILLHGSAFLFLGLIFIVYFHNYTIIQLFNPDYSQT